MAVLSDFYHNKVTFGNWVYLDGEVVGAGGSGGAVTLDLSGYPGAFINVLGQWRTDRSAVDDSVSIALNGDTGGNYVRSEVFLKDNGFSSSVPDEGNTSIFLQPGSPAASSPTSVFSSCDMLLSRDDSIYTIVNINNHIYRDSADHRRDLSQYIWTNTALPVSIQFDPVNGTEFVEGSRFFAFAITAEAE